MSEPTILPFDPPAERDHQARLRIASWLRGVATMLETDGAETQPTRAVLVLMGRDDFDVAGPPGTTRKDVLDASMVIYRRLTPEGRPWA